MAHATKSTTQPIHTPSLYKQMAVGAGIGLVLISSFLLSADEPNPEWGKFWMIRPLVIVLFAGAMGGLCDYFIMHFHNRAGVNQTVATIVSLLVGIIGLFMGVVLGLDGTMWD